MKGAVVKAALMCIGLGCAAQLFQHALQSNFINKFLQEDLLNMLVALFAINTATIGLLLTRIRDIAERSQSGSTFAVTRAQCLLSVREQLALIILALLLLTIAESPCIEPRGSLRFGIDALLVAVFAYAILVLYDTAKAVFVLVDFPPNTT